MVYLTLFILYTSLFNYCYCFQVPSKFSSIGDNVIVLCVLAAFGTISLIGACALCFKRKKTFEKLENEAGSPENIKKNEFPIFRALATEISESSAIVPCERNNLSRDNLLNSSDNLVVSDDNGSLRKSVDGIDSSDVVLLEKTPNSSQREKQQINRDTIIFETEKKHQSPSSKTPLLYAKNVQSYQEQQPINEQIQQKSVAAAFLSSSSSDNFYNVKENDLKNIDELDAAKGAEEVEEFVVRKNATTDDSKGNPFFNSTIEDGTVKEVFKDDASEIESSINDNSEKYQILEEETDGEEIKIDSTEDLPLRLERQNSKGSNCSNADKSIEEALRALDIAIGFGDDDEENDGDELEAVIIESKTKVNLDDIKEEATFLVDSIVNDCEKILKQKHGEERKDVAEAEIEEVGEDAGEREKLLLLGTDDDSPDLCFKDFLSLRNQDISTPCKHLKTATKTFKSSSNNNNTQDTLIAKALFADGVDLSTDEIIYNNETFPVPSNNTYTFSNADNNDNKNNQTFDVHLPNVGGDKTFDTVDVQQSSEKTNSIPTIKVEKEKDEMSSEDLTTVTPVNTPIELSYSSETWNKISYNKDLGTAIPSCSSSATVAETVAQNKTFNANDCGEITFNHDGWYLHSQSRSDTFDICEDIDDDENETDGNMEDMSSTFDQLRRQLTEMLPHAQGMSAHNDFLDDDLNNKDSNSPSDNYGIKYGELDEASNAGAFDLIGAILNPEPVTELNINYNNYKRPLSPIMEESECDETCRTFIMNNDTKLLDSTSTGIMESASDAVMGQMPKNLMASNDTLFNFEDTLSDQTDILMSPRITGNGSSTSSTLSRNESHDRISNERTPTNEDLPKILMVSDIIESPTCSNAVVKCQDAIDILKNNIRQHPLNLDLNIADENDAAQNTASKYELAKMALEEGSWPLELPEAQQIINDLSSPEQNRTADSLSFEQDITYTIDDQKTCVSLVLKNDDEQERISEISEPLFASESLDVMLADDANSLAIDDAISLDIDDNFNFEMNDENGNQPTVAVTPNETKESEIYLKEIEVGTNYENDSINPHQRDKTVIFDADSLEPEQKILNDEMEADSIPASQMSKSVYSNDSINENTVQNSDNSESDCVIVKDHHDSSEESECSDRKKGSSSQDIRQVSCNQSVMSTSFSKEWSDDDSSHSSEEFMYVKGDAEGLAKDEEVEGTSNENEKDNVRENEYKTNDDNDEDDDDDVKEMEYQEWNIETMPHRKSPTLEDVGGSEEDESGEEESEFVPSYWDQSLQPSKSSLKSPEKEKEASPDQEQEQPQIKTKRRVVFKIQRYHSVYEYPSEVVQLSPAYSEPQLWSNYLEDCGGNIDYFTYSNQLHDIPDTIDGFNISSSSRPFHTANVQLHNTWPNENDHDFSWSQFQESNEENDSVKLGDIPLKIEWPIRKHVGFDEDDSGLCEPSESPSMGELNFSKGSLRLPLELISSTSSEVSDFMSTDTKELEAVDIHNEESFKPKNFVDHDDDLSEKLHDAIPTPLGSMDSLSSNSHSSSSNSSSPPSFTTFGKDNKIIKESDVIGKKSIIFIENDQNLTQLENVINTSQKRSKNVEAIDKNIKIIVGSSDDDSGFENVKCEAK